MIIEPYVYLEEREEYSAMLVKHSKATNNLVIDRKKFIILECKCKGKCQECLRALEALVYNVKADRVVEHSIITNRSRERG
jgi:hypothetical protein